ncbi:type II toxin-antitoxin system RatA family toxin [Kaarinaea lacus]
MITGKLIDVFDHQISLMDYSDSAIFDYAPQQVFDVIADIERYPEFLPGWISVNVVARQANTVEVEQKLGFALLSWCFTSDAIFEPPFHIHIKSLKGSFLHLDIDWVLTPVEDNKTRVSLVVKSDSAPGPHHHFLHSIFSNSTRTLLSYFKERLALVYDETK